MDAEDFVMAGLINGVAWLIPYCTNAHILGERRAGDLAQGEHGRSPHVGVGIVERCDQA